MFKKNSQQNAYNKYGIYFNFFVLNFGMMECLSWSERETRKQLIANRINIFNMVAPYRRVHFQNSMTGWLARRTRYECDMGS